MLTYVEKWVIIIKNILLNKYVKLILLFLLILFIILSAVLFIIITSNPKTLKEDNSNTYSRYVFFGDSLIAGNNWGVYYPNDDIINSGIGGNKTEDLLNRVDRDVIRYKPEKVILLAGVNDLRYGSTKSQTYQNLCKIISVIKLALPDTEIYLESLYPISLDIIDAVTNDEIRKMNDYYESIAKEYDLTYIDVGSNLMDTKGYLKSEYTVDGLHLNSNGYKKVLEVLNKYLI